MKKIFKIQFIFYFFLVISLGIMVFAMISFKADNNTISNSQIRQLEGWKITFSDGSCKHISLPGKVSAEKEETIVLSNTLTEDSFGLSLAFHTENQRVVVRFDGKKVYDFGNEKDQMFGQSPGSAWHYVSIPGQMESGKVEIELTSPFANLGGDADIILCGAKSSCILYFMNHEWFGLVCGGALFLFGLLFMLYHLAMGHLKLKNTGMFHIGISAVLLAVYMIIETGMLQIFYGNARLYYLAGYLALFTSVVPFVFYLADTVFEDLKKRLHIWAGIFTCSFVVSLTLQMCNVLDFYEYFFAFRILVFIFMGYLVLQTLHIFYKKEQKSVHVFMLVLSIAEVAALIIERLVERYDRISLDCFVLFTMILVLGTVNIFKVVKEFRENLEERMETNAELTNKLVEEHDSLLNEISFLKSSKEYADKYSASKSLFLSSVSKKLIVPITNIMGMSELVIRDEISDSVKEKIVSIQSEGTTALTLTNNIIDYTQYETNALELKCVAYQVEKLLYDMNESISVALIDKDVDFIVDFSPNIPKELYGDELRIRQILSTILANAVRYTKEGTIRFKVGAELVKADEVNLNVVISDSGSGIEEENLDSLFDMFLLYNTDAKVAGTGLGLAVCKKLLDLMNGTITVESKIGEGTTFAFTIPQKIINGMPLVEVDDRNFKTLVYEINLLQKMMLKKAFLDLGLDGEFVSNDEEFRTKLDSGIYHTILICGKEYEEHKEYLEQPLNVAMRKVVMADISNTIQSYENADILQRPIHCMNLYDAISGKDIVELVVMDDSESGFVAPQANILVVDDNPANLKIAIGLMEPFKMNVQIAVGGTACLEMLMESMEYDMVFLDYSMTGISGVETLRNLREYNDRYYKTLPVIAMSSQMINGGGEVFIEEGFDDCISKPLEQGQIRSILEKYLSEDKIIRSETSDENNELQEDTDGVV